MTSKKKRPADAAPAADMTGSPQAASPLRQGSGGSALRQRAEAIALEKVAQSPESLDAMSPEATRQTLHELRVHQIELEMQNEELRRAQAELDASRSRYFDLYDLAPVGYVTLSEQGLILEANLTAATLLDAARGARANLPISRFIHKEDQDNFYRLRMQLIETGEPHSFELRMVKSDGTQIWVQLAATAAQGEGGATVFRVVLSDITARKQAEVMLQSSLREKEALLKEVHHRVKNNLQVITSLLRLESGRSAQPATKSVLSDMQGRIRSMALLHELLYRSGTFAAVDLGAYLRQLTTQSFLALAAQPGSIQLHLDLASAPVGIDQAIPCGLLENELISNCIKHGFPDGRSGEVRVELQLVDGGPQLRLRVSDTGVGLPVDFEARRGNSLGLQLVSNLARQLGGTLEIGPGPAAVFTVTFTVEEPKSSANPRL